MTDQQIDTILKLVSKTVDETAANGKRMYILTMILALAFSVTIAWVSYFYFTVDYTYPTIMQTQKDSDGGNAKITVGKGGGK